MFVNQSIHGCKLNYLIPCFQIYHEATVTNILEVFLYHRTATETCEEALVELIDYCYRRFVDLTGEFEKMPEEQRNMHKDQTKDELMNMDPVKDLDR